MRSSLINLGGQYHITYNNATWYKAVYATRKSTIEPVLGIIKSVIGFRQFLLRGLDAAKGEWDLVCIAFNLKRLYALSK